MGLRIADGGIERTTDWGFGEFGYVLGIWEVRILCMYVRGRQVQVHVLYIHTYIWWVFVCSRRLGWIVSRIVLIDIDKDKIQT